MATELRGAYSFLKYFSTATHQEMCRDLTRRLRAKSESANLAEWFVDSLVAHQAFDNRGESFIGKQKRTDLTTASTGTNRITFLLQQQSKSRPIDVISGPESYQFRYIEREVAPLRQTGKGQRFSGAGGIDYIALADRTPILGEIKCKDDANPFFAFIQLLTYLSEFATPNQIARANKHLWPRSSVEIPTSIDLHILLADFNDRGLKNLIAPTQELAAKFKLRLQADHPEAAAWVGKILCLQLKGTATLADLTQGLTCLWYV